MVELFAHVSNVVAHCKLEVVLTIQLFTLKAHLLDEPGIVVEIELVQSLFFIIREYFGEFGRGLDRLRVVPAVRQFVFRLHHLVLGHRLAHLVPAGARMVKLGDEGVL